MTHPRHTPAPSLMRYLLTLLILLAACALPAYAADDDLSVNARLLLAARSGDAAAVQRALNAGASIDSRNRLGETALVIALKRNDVALAEMLIRTGADVNLAAINGTTPLMAA